MYCQYIFVYRQIIFVYFDPLFIIIPFVKLVNIPIFTNLFLSAVFPAQSYFFIDNPFLIVHNDFKENLRKLVSLSFTTTCLVLKRKDYIP